MDHRLEVYVAGNCYGCDEARVVAGGSVDRFPDLDVAVIDLDDPAFERPAAVFAVPAYLLDGELLWLGNLRREDAAQRIADFLEKNQQE